MSAITHHARRRALALVAAVALAAALAPPLSPPAAAQPDAAAWPQYLSDQANTWRSGASGPADPGYKWFVDYSKVQTDEAPEGYNLATGRQGDGMPVAADGTLVLRAQNNVTDSRSVIGVDADDGAVLWEIPDVYDRFGTSFCEPAIDSQNRVWLHPADTNDDGAHEVVAFDLTDGSEIAGTRLEVDAACGTGSVHLASDGDGGEWLVLPGGTSGPDFTPSAPPEEFTVVDIADDEPEIAWSFDEGEAPFDGTVGVSRGGASSAGRFFPRPVVASEDAVYLVGWTDDGGDGTHEIFEFGLADGDLRSSTDAPAPDFDADLDDEPIAATDYRRWQLMLTGDDELVVGPWTGDSDAFVAVYDISNGLPDEPTWLERFPDSSQPGRLALGNDVVHVQPDGRGVISGLSLATGATEWESEFSAGPSVVSRDSVAPVDADGAFYSLANITPGAIADDLIKHDAQGQRAWWFHESAAQEAARADLGDPELEISFRSLRVGGIDDDGTIYLADRTSEWLLAIDGSGGLGEAVEDDEEDRVSGDNRFETAIGLAEEFDEADTVLIARGDDFPDALAGAPLASQLEAPILLSSPGSLAAATLAEIDRLGASQARLLGGTAALSPTVEGQLEAAGPDVERYAGADRWETASLIADELEDTDAAYVARGRVIGDPDRGWEDAVAVSALAAFTGTPILLTDTDELPADTSAALAGRSEVTIVGGEAVVSPEVEAVIDAGEGSRTERLAGADRWETSANIADASIAAGMDPSTTWIATGRNFPDALAAAPVVGATAPQVAQDAGGVLLLVDGLDLDRSQASRDWLATNAGDIDRIRAVGGSAVITDATLDAMRSLTGSN